MVDLVRLGAKVDFRNNKSGRSALAQAVAVSNAASTRVLLHVLSADPDLPDAAGLTPLMLATRQGWSMGVRLLLGAGACPGRANAHGLSAATLAVGVPQSVVRLEVMSLLRAAENEASSGGGGAGGGEVKYGLYFCRSDGGAAEQLDDATVQGHLQQISALRERLAGTPSANQSLTSAQHPAQRQPQPQQHLQHQFHQHTLRGKWGVVSNQRPTRQDL